MRYWNMARQRYCCGLARCWRALRLSADRAENAARKRALFGALIEESGSHMTRRWREQDSNHRSPVRRAAVLSLPPSPAELVVVIAEVMVPAEIAAQIARLRPPTPD